MLKLKAGKGEGEGKNESQMRVWTYLDRSLTQLPLQGEQVKLDKLDKVTSRTRTSEGTGTQENELPDGPLNKVPAHTHHCHVRTTPVGITNLR